MRATVHGPGIMPVWCSPLRHSWTVQCWTKAEQQGWICTLTGWAETITPSAMLADSLLLFSTWLVSASKVLSLLLLFVLLWMVFLGGSKAKLLVNDPNFIKQLSKSFAYWKLPLYYLENWQAMQAVLQIRKSLTSLFFFWSRTLFLQYVWNCHMWK